MIYAIRQLLRKGINTPTFNGLIVEDYKYSDHQFGDVLGGKKVIKTNGQWLDCLPKEERQSGRKVETMGCTGYGLNNAIEALVKAKYGIEVNYSDRYLNKMSGVTRSGNSMAKVLDTARKLFGEVNEEDWTWSTDDFTWDMYYADIPKAVIAKGQDWIRLDTLTYNVVGDNHALMKEALKYSPLYACGYAWYLENGLYRSYGRANHCFTIVGYEDGKCWYVFDSYSPFIKKLAWDYLFGGIYGIDLEILNQTEIERKKLLSQKYKYAFRAQSKGQVYRIEDGVQVDIKDLDNDLATTDPEISKETSTATAKLLFDKKVMVPVSEELYNKIK